MSADDDALRQHRARLREHQLALLVQQARYRHQLEVWIQLLLYPGLACLMVGAYGGAWWRDLLVVVGVFCLGIVLGLIVAQALSYPSVTDHACATTEEP